MGIGIGDQELGIGIGDWDSGLGFGIGIGIGVWDWGFGLGIGIWYWNLGFGLGIIDEVVNNPGQISEQINRKISGLEEALHQGSFDRIGGRGTLREIWARLKRLQMVSGVKRKLADRDWESYGPLGPVGEEGYGSSGW